MTWIEFCKEGLMVLGGCFLVFIVIAVVCLTYFSIVSYFENNYEAKIHKLMMKIAELENENDTLRAQLLLGCGEEHGTD